MGGGDAEMERTPWEGAIAVVLREAVLGLPVMESDNEILMFPLEPRVVSPWPVPPWPLP